MSVVPLVDFRLMLCVLLFISRLGDIGSTFLITPKLKLEANPIVRKLGWPFALSTIALCLLPYLSTQLAVMALIPSLLISASNTGKVWMVRTMGEEAYTAFLIGLARKSKLSYALIGTTFSFIFLMLTGGLVLFFYRSPENDWGFWIGMGIVTYAMAIGLWSGLYWVRLFKKAKMPLETDAVDSAMS